MMRALAFFSALLVSSGATLGSTYPVDDTGTLISQPLTPMRWRQLAPIRAADHMAEGRLQAALRLNLSAWVQRPVRLYMMLAPGAGNHQQLSVSWRSQGRLLPGTLRPGGRTLIFEGLIAEPFLTEGIELTIAADGRELAYPQTLRFSFEIEVPP